jgi:hypothetical protein
MKGEIVDRYILDKNNNPVPEPDLLKWGKWLQTTKRSVARTEIPGDDDKPDVSVSTVFLGLDHSFASYQPSEGVWETFNEGGYKPVLWETMIFGGSHDQYQERYTSYADAVAGHEKAVQLVQAWP